MVKFPTVSIYRDLSRLQGASNPIYWDLEGKEKVIMKKTSVILQVLVGLLILQIPSSGFASDLQKGKPAHQDVQSESEKKEALIRTPIYKPPLRGAPVGRLGGGTRGVGSEIPVIVALVPDHVGLTVQEQASLHWYLSKPTDHLVEFTLIDDQSIQPILEKRFGPPVRSGVHQVRLADYGVSLSPDKQYKWFVALVIDPEHRSKDIIAGGAIELVAFPETLRSKLSHADKAEAPGVYAEAGIWYDALSAISGLIEAAPGDSALRKKRAFLLEQVGLTNVVKE